MAKKESVKAPANEPANNPNILRVPAWEGGRSQEALWAEIAYDPAARSLAGARGFIKGTMGEQALTESLEALNVQVKEVQSGNLGSAEKTLVAQANTLDAIFNELARRAALNMGEYLNATEIYLRLALKAQSQCRATLETLAAIKNPQPVAFVRQANIAHGPQQVNNTEMAEASRAGNFKNQPNKVLEHQHGERLDFGAAGAASGANPTLETVGAVHRPQDAGG